MFDANGWEIRIMRHTLGSKKHKTILVNGYYSSPILDEEIPWGWERSAAFINFVE